MLENLPSLRVFSSRSHTIDATPSKDTVRCENMPHMSFSSVDGDGEDNTAKLSLPWRRIIADGIVRAWEALSISSNIALGDPFPVVQSVNAGSAAGG